ncbi:MAG TPA: hypothetical protein VFB79_01585 [Candidatus Angelobacter sp.]|nr:hypothetical protein [Candidatus Angelobacter sp.]
MTRKSFAQQLNLSKAARSMALLTLALLGLMSASLAATLSDDHKDKDNDREKFAIGLWGDLPYSDLQAQVGIPNLIADMNKQDLAFTVHDGDLKAGNGTPGSVTPTTCVDALYTQALGFFNALRAPAAFTTGDNDWADCDRLSNGGFNSLERLDHERALFFNTPFSLGQQKMRMEVQSTPLCLSVNGPAPCVENRRWTMGGVTFVTLNIQGSCNNLCDTNPDPAEFAARNAADIAWMKDSFAVAKARNSAAIMLISQADPGFDLSTGVGAPLRDPRTLVETDGLPDGFHDFLVALRDQVVAFQKPVAYVHGDSHYFRIDKPFLNAAGQRLENFTRVETFGDNQQNGTNDVNWLKVFVDANSREVFSYQTQIVPGNRVAVPAPATTPAQ